MQEIINKLAEYTRQRDILNLKIECLTEIIEESNSLKGEKPKRTYKPRGASVAKPSKKRDQKTGKILRKYRCSDCALGFESDKEYRDVRCPACESKKVLSLPSGGGEDE